MLPSSGQARPYSVWRGESGREQNQSSHRDILPCFHLLRYQRVSTREFLGWRGPLACATEGRREQPGTLSRRKTRANIC